MKKKLSDSQLPPAAVDVKGDYVGGYLLVGSAKTVHDLRVPRETAEPFLHDPIWKLEALS